MSNRMTALVCVLMFLVLMVCGNYALDHSPTLQCRPSAKVVC